MAKSNLFSNALLRLLFNGDPIPGLAVVPVDSPLASLYIGLHTADPGAGGDQATSEALYTGYARKAVSRIGSSVFTVTGAQCKLTGSVELNTCTAGTTPVVATHFSIGTSASGSGLILYRGLLTPSLSITAGYTPTLTGIGAITEG